MKMESSRSTQSKLEAKVAIGFSLAIMILSSTSIGYVELAYAWNIDLALVFAIFAAMIGGYRVGIPVAIVWGFISYFNPASGLQIFGLSGIILMNLTLVTTTYGAYVVCKKYFRYSPINVYRAIIAAVVSKNLVAVIILGEMSYGSAQMADYMWLDHVFQQFIIELGISLLAMAMVIRHLRQVHILNGVKRREQLRRLEDFKKIGG